MMNMGPGSIRGGCVQGDDVTITTFFLAVGIPTLSTAISEARRYAEAGGDARGPGGWGQRVFTFGLFAVAALFLAAGFYWWLLRGRSWRITVILQQVATSGPLGRAQYPSHPRHSKTTTTAGFGRIERHHNGSIRERFGASGCEDNSRKRRQGCVFQRFTQLLC